MSKYEKVVTWLDSYRDIAFELLRIYLGVGLFVRGLIFLLYPSTFAFIASPGTAWLATPFVYYAVSLTHVIGGALLAAGLLTRLAALSQIPILLGAVLFVHLQGGLVTADQSLEFSTLVLFLLVLIFLHGPGRWSVDHRWSHPARPFDPFAERLTLSGDKAFELLRIYLGIGLLVRGFLFITDSSTFVDLLGPSTAAQFSSLAIIHIVALVHLGGGAMLAAGLLTRVAALAQIPILFGAVFFVHLQGGLVTPSQSLEFSVLVLFLLILVFLYGPGRWSADAYVAQQRAQAEVESAPRARPQPFPVSEYHPSAPRETVGGAGTAETAVAEPVVAAPAAKPAPVREPLTCPLLDDCPVVASEHPRDHPWVIPTRRYGPRGVAYFMLGITGPPREVSFHCKKCGQTLQTTRAQEDLDYYKYH